MIKKSIFPNMCSSILKQVIIFTICVSMVIPVQALAAPYGGQVTSGSATIMQSGTVTNINQSTNRATINWLGFSIAPNETVNFNQPSALAMTLNRVIGNEKSIIAGALNANGRVYIINANGIVFTHGASVNVGGLVASTLNITDDDFNKGNFVFQGNGQSGQVINMGTIRATGDGTTGGYVALLGDQVKNEGVIVAERGTVSLNGAQKVTLNFNGDSLVNVSLDEGSLNALVETKKAIITDGGKVILTAKAANDLVASQVNVEGVVQARTLADLTGGSITANAYGGTTTVSGTLDTSAPDGGNGGTIETSGTAVKIADTASITTASAKGKTGTWTIDPDGFTIAASGGNITGAALASQLARTNVTIESTQGSGTSGNIDVNAAVAWAANTSLTLDATHAININAALTPTGTSGGIVLLAGTNIAINTPLSLGSSSFTATAGDTINVAAALTWTGNQTLALTAANNINLYGTLTGGNGTLKLTSTGGNIAFDGVTSLAATTINASAAKDIDVNAALTWTGDTTATLTAGNDININAPLTATGTNAGLVMNYGTDYTIWTSADYSGAVLNSAGIPVAQRAPTGAVYGSITLSGANASLTMNGTKYTLIHNMSDVAALQTYLSDSKLTGTCAGSSGTCYWNPTTQAFDIAQTKDSASGSYWWNATTQAYDIPDYNATTGKYYSVSGGTYIFTSSQLKSSKYYTYYYDIATASYDTQSAYTGTGYYYNTATGLYDLKSVYYALASNIDASTSYSSSALTDANGKYYYTNSPINTYSGTLAGLGHTVDNLTISAASTNNVGLIGAANSGSVLRDIGLTNVNINGSWYVGALLGKASGALTVTGAYSTGSVAGASYAGGLIGAIMGDTAVASAVSSCYSEADVSANAAGTALGGLIGYFASGYITHSDATGNVTGNTGNTGGLVGKINTMSGSSIVTGMDLVYATGAVTNPGKPGGNYDAYAVGGLVGYAGGSSTKVQLTNSFSTGDVSGYAFVGGLLGYGSSANLDNTYHTTGAVTSSGYHYLGGVVGYLGGTGGLAGVLVSSDVANSFATVNVTSTSPPNSTRATCVGGLIGYFGGTATDTITNSWATGTITAASSNNVGGLVGFINLGIIDNCWANAHITGVDYVGGLVGKAYGNGSTATDAVKIINSTAYGSVSGRTYVGGILGYAADTTYGGALGTPDTYSGAFISGSVSYANVTGSGDYIGGIVGRGNIVTDSTAYGTVTSTGTGTNVGDITGSLLHEDVSAGNSYSSGGSYTAPGTPDTSGIIGTDPGQTAAQTAAGAVSGAASTAAGAVASGTPSADVGQYGQYGQFASSSLATQTGEQVVRVSGGQQASASQPVDVAPVAVSVNTETPSLGNAIRNFFSSDGQSDNGGGGGSGSYSAGVKAITADGVTYIVDDSSSGGSSSGGTQEQDKKKKNAGTSEQ